MFVAKRTKILLTISDFLVRHFMFVCVFRTIREIDNRVPYNVYNYAAYMTQTTSVRAESEMRHIMKRIYCRAALKLATKRVPNRDINGKLRFVGATTAIYYCCF